MKIKNLLLVLAVLSAAFTFSSCERSSVDENVEDAAERTGKAVEDFGDATKDAVEDAADGVQ